MVVSHFCDHLSDVQIGGSFLFRAYHHYHHFPEGLDQGYLFRLVAVVLQLHREVEGQSCPFLQVGDEVGRLSLFGADHVVEQVVGGGGQLDHAVLFVLLPHEFEIVQPRGLVEIGVLSKHDFGQDQPQGVDVCLVVDLLVLQFLNWGVQLSTLFRDAALLVLVQADRNAEVSNFEDRVLDEDVLRFEVVVDDPAAVEEAVAVDQVLQNGQELPQAELSLRFFPPRHQVCQSSVIAILHHDVVVVLGYDLEGVDLHDILALIGCVFAVDRCKVVYLIQILLFFINLILL